MKNIGFIGLGNMGYHMSNNLLNNDFHVSGYDQNFDLYKNYENSNFFGCENLTELSKNKDVIITMLPDGSSVNEIFSKLLEKLDKKTILIDCSTIDINTCKLLHKKCKEKNINFLDAPVSGGTIGAKNATLTFMVGGIKDIFKKITPLLDNMGKQSIFCGPEGSGQGIKMCNNLLLAITMSGLGEVLRVANNENLDLKKLYEVLSTSTASCWALNNYCPIKGVGEITPADKNFEPGFATSLMFKDLGIALESGKDLKLEISNLVFKKYEDMIKQKMGKLDFSAIVNNV